MKKSLFICLLIIIIFAFSSCNEASHNTDPQEEGVINVDNGSLDKNLSSMKAGDELSFRMGSEGTLNLSGVTLDSLFSVEFEASGAKEASHEVRGGNSEISRVDKNGPYILLPQSDGEVSFSGSDVGASLDEGTVKLKKIGNDLRIAKNYVEYDVLETGIDYRAEGYPEYLHPTYQNYINIDFNTPQWSSFKDKKVVIMQNMFYDSPLGEDHSCNYTDRFGLLENGKVIYSNEIEGLYDLSESEDDTLNLYTYLRASYVKGKPLVFRTYLLIPEDVSEEPLDIVGYPHVYKFSPNNQEKKYEIRLSAIPKSDFEMVVSSILQGRPRYTGAGEKGNGQQVGKPLWIKTISENADDNTKMDAVLIYTGGKSSVKEEFIVNYYWRNYAEQDTVFGKISSGIDEGDWGVHEIDLKGKDIYDSDEISLGGDNPLFHSIQFTIPEGQSYTLTVSSTSSDIRLLSSTNRRIGSGRFNDPITLESKESGHVTLYTMGQEATLSYQLTKN